MKHFDHQRLVRLAFFIALEIILSRFCSISTPIAKIGFAFVPVALCGMLYGPVYGGLVGACADFLGANLFPIAPFFPGFTLTSFLTGFCFGLCLNRRSDSWKAIILAVTINCVFLSLALNTYWLSIMRGTPFWALVPTRVIQCLILIPVQTVILRMMGSRRVQSILGGRAAA